MPERWLSSLVIAVLALGHPTATAAQDPAALPPVPTAAADLATLRSGVSSWPAPVEDVAAWSDGVMRVLMEELHVVGGVVSIVSEGEPFFTRGYGFADWRARTPVDPETTLFRIGSVSKLFVWTSVMQMVEEGRIDLDADVNEYLDFEIPATYEDPVTLSDIMAHAGGFEDYVIELFGDDPEDVRPLGEILADQIPARVRPPGDVSSYSNHATGMAAYAVERVSGTEWKALVEERILEPLGMEHTTFRQPLPEVLEADMSRGYRYRSGTFEEEDFEYVPLAPVGAAAASASDMARFMIAHLQLGRFGDERILSEATARRMQTVHHRMAPAVNGMAHGFIESSRDGVHIIGHGGDTRWFHTMLALFPEHDLGVFVSFNSQQGGAARSRFLDAFVERYFPVEDVLPEPPEDFGERAERFTGVYMGNRFSHTTLAKVGRGTVEVSATDRGTLRAMDGQWVEVAPLVFDEEAGSRRLVFREGEDGTVTHFFLAGTPVIAWERVPSLETPALQVVLLALSVVVVVLTLVSPVVGWAARRWYGVSDAALVRIPAAARHTLRGAAVLLGLGSLAVLVLIQTGSLGVAVPSGLGLALALPVIGVIPVVGSLAFTVRLWMRGEGRLLPRILYSGAAVVLCLLIWQLSVWNLLGWNY